MIMNRLLLYLIIKRGKTLLEVALTNDHERSEILNSQNRAASLHSRLNSKNLK